MGSNIKAKFSHTLKESIYERDGGCCIICGTNSNLQFHHALFGTECIYTKQRNTISQGVTICFKCHLNAHSCSKGDGVREKCIIYLKNYYEN